jgi:hypothetical protein
MEKNRKKKDNGEMEGWLDEKMNRRIDGKR